MRLIFLGAPGAGKGTQAQILADLYNIPRLSTSDMLRAVIATGSEEGRRLKNIMDAGHLIPDDIINNLVESRLKQDDVENGFIFDGYPRTIAQAEALDASMHKLGLNDVRVLNLEVDQPELIRRFTGRFTCVSCGTSYHKESKRPKIEGICDQCGGNEFAVRPDDNEEAVKVRLKTYHEKTAPLINFYKEKGMLLAIHGEQDIDKITAEILSLLGFRGEIAAKA